MNSHTTTKGSLEAICFVDYGNDKFQSALLKMSFELAAPMLIIIAWIHGSMEHLRPGF